MAESGVCSRRAAEEIIRAGRVKINGRPVKLGDKMIPGKDLLTVDDARIEVDKNREHKYIMLYKPRGYVTTAKDEMGRRTVMQLLDGVEGRVYPIGRLDKNSEGLLLFTNDGEFANEMMHPKHGISKLYRVTVRPRATEEQITALASGVTLDDGSQTLPASVKVVTEEDNRTVMEISIREGKNRQIRRMCDAVNLTVIRLKRSSVGALKLGMLQPGQHRELTSSEITNLKAASAKALQKNEQKRREAR